MRLEIESKVARGYTWVVHHTEGVKSVVSGETLFHEVKSESELLDRTWYYDTASQNLYVRDRVASGQDHIVNVAFLN